MIEILDKIIKTAGYMLGLIVVIYLLLVVWNWKESGKWPWQL